MKRGAWVVVGSLLVAHSVAAQFTQQGSKVVGTGAVGAAEQGMSVAISADGTTAIVGGYFDGNAAGGANITKTPPCQCDGMTLPSPVQANMIDVNGGAVPLVSHPSLAVRCTPSSQVRLIHPFPGVSPVQVPAGSRLVTLELPWILERSWSL